MRVLALLVGLALAITATATLVLTEDLQLLRLAVIAALWAFLIAAFVAGQRRWEQTPDMSPGTELELRKEVQLRREIEGALREDVVALRGDLARLRHDILERWDGELRVERVEVTSESTRVSGFGATFQALQDEAARRLGTEGRPQIPVQAAPSLREALDNASTVEFSIVPPPVGSAYPPDVAPKEPARRRRRDAGDAETSVDAATLLSRLTAETASSAHGSGPRRRRYRDDDEPNDVLARVLRR